MLQQSTRNERLMARLSAVFGTLATLLATIGLYGVLAYTVTRRTREIGIRMALGALRSHVSWLVLREVVILAVAGMAIALPAAWWLGRFVKSQLLRRRAHGSRDDRAGDGRPRDRRAAGRAGADAACDAHQPGARAAAGLAA